MITAAIIAEYNPFHNGHAYQIGQVKEITGADHIVVLMSGDFVQRGEPAIMDKYLRTEMALHTGADFVFEIPVCIAVSSAEDYAMGAVRILNNMHAIDYLCFGAETEDLSLLSFAAGFFANETEDYKSSLHLLLSDGISYPRARQQAFEKLTGINGEFLAKPNNILAIAYLQALLKLKSRITPVVIKRIGDYHSQSLEGRFASATAIRRSLTADNESLEKLLSVLPEETHKLYKENYKKTYPVSYENIWPILNYRLLMEESHLTDLYDIPMELYNRLVKIRPQAQGFYDLTSRMVSPSYTKSRIRRCFIHILLGLDKASVYNASRGEGSGYVRLLGFHKGHEQFLSVLKAQAGIKVLHKAYPSELSEPADRSSLILYNLDARASEIYTMLQRKQYPICNYIHEFSRKLIKII